MNRSRIESLSLAILLVVWLFVVTLNYYTIHKPFGIENALAILSALGDVLVALAIFVLSAMIGKRLIRSMTFASPLEALVIEIGLGVVPVSFVIFGLSILGVVQPILFWVLVLTAFILLRRDLVFVLNQVRSLEFPAPSRLEKMLAIFVGTFLVLGLLSTLTPPVSWDALDDHLLRVRTIIENGRITTPPDIPYFSFPALVEMLFLAATLLKGDIAAQTIHFGYLLLVLGAVFAFGQRFFNLRAAWLGTALLVGVPSFMVIGTWAYVDIALAFYSFVALYALIVARENNDERWLMLAGAFAGGAMGVKYTSVIVPAALFLIVLLRRDFKIRHWVMMLGSAALVACPWYLRNLILMGNPVYPFVFGGLYWDAFRAYWFGRFGTGLMNDPLRLLIVPWDVTIMGVEGKVGYQATIGPLLLILLPMLAVYLLPKRLSGTRKIVGELLIFALVLYVFWLFGIFGSDSLMQTRLLFPVFPTLAVLAACAFEASSELDLPQFSLQRFTTMFAGIVFALTGIAYALDFISNNPLPYIAGFESRASYLARNLGGYDAVARWIDANLSDTSKTLLLWEPRSYYIHRNTQPDSILDLSPHLFWKHGNADALAAALRSAGYTHVLVNRAGLENILETHMPMSDGELVMWQDFAARYLESVYPKPLDWVDARQRMVPNADSDPYAVYEILPGPSK